MPKQEHIMATNPKDIEGDLYVVLKQTDASLPEVIGAYNSEPLARQAAENFALKNPDISVIITGHIDTARASLKLEWALWKVSA
jgi:hypothetical protein